METDSILSTGVAGLEHPIQERIIKIKYLPINLFAAVMGIAGLSLAWRSSVALFNVPIIISQIIDLLAVIVFVVITIAYIVKFALYRQDVAKEFYHPIIGNFFGTFPIAVLLISMVIRPYYAELSFCVWVTGTVLIIGLAYIIVARLLNNKQELLHATPAWVIPGVGTLDVAVTAGGLSSPWIHEVNMLSFVIGAVLALVFLVLIISRLIHQDPMPAGMNPSLIILIAPFAVGYACISPRESLTLLLVLCLFRQTSNWFLSVRLW